MCKRPCSGTGQPAGAVQPVIYSASNIGRLNIIVAYSACVRFCSLSSTLYRCASVIDPTGRTAGGEMSECRVLGQDWRRLQDGRTFPTLSCCKVCLLGLNFLPADLSFFHGILYFLYFLYAYVIICHMYTCTLTPMHAYVHTLHAHAKLSCSHINVDKHAAYA